MRRLLLFLLLASVRTVDAASPVWVVVGEAQAPLSARCGPPIYQWNASIVLHNFGERPAAVRLLGYSNGGSAVGTSEIVIDANHSAATLLPRPAVLPSGPVYVLKLEAADSVKVESRLEYAYASCDTLPVPLGPAGQIQLPVFHSLTPAGRAQIHLGTDLGFQNARVNVGVYNGGDVSTTARVAVHHPACAAEPPAMTEVTIAPDTLVQVTAASRPCSVPQDRAVPQHVAYTVVTVDQPSLSYVTTLSNIQTPNVSVVAATPQQ